jgi:hypothetical protein
MKQIFFLLTLSALLFSTPASSRDTQHMLSIEAAMNSADFKERLDPDIRFYFGTQAHPEIEQSFGNFVSNKKTNAFGKSDEAACEWVLLSALLSFQDRVKAEGGNAVVNLNSYYKKNSFSSETEYECHAGGIMAGVALQGDVVKIAE